MRERALIGVVVLRGRDATWVARTWDGNAETDEKLEAVDPRASGRFVRALVAARYGLPIDLVVEG